jgi:hypothetical protein
MDIKIELICESIESTTWNLVCKKKENRNIKSTWESDHLGEDCRPSDSEGEREEQLPLAREKNPPG